MKINHEETKNMKKDQKKPSCSPFLRGWFAVGFTSIVSTGVTI